MPPVAVSVVEDPVQMLTLDPALIVGMLFTVTVTAEVLLQPLVLPVTVYVVVTVDVATTDEPVFADKSVDGVHE